MNSQIKHAILSLPLARRAWSLIKSDPGPAPHGVKQAAISELAASHDLKVFVETGTYLGDMVDAMKGKFEKLYSIELSEELHEAAAARFAGQENIRILQGDSGEKIAEVIAELRAPALFWLDGHYSGGMTAKAETDTPVWAELEHIFDAPDLGHVILIDDARLFGRDPAYPTVQEIAEFAINRRPEIQVDVVNDSIRLISPKR